MRSNSVLHDHFVNLGEHLFKCFQDQALSGNLFHLLVRCQGQEESMSFPLSVPSPRFAVGLGFA